MPGCSARTYIAPPYKHQSSNYERRMKAARKANKTRVASLAQTLRAIPDDDQVLPGMVVDLTRVPVSEKLEWIENMINEMDSIVNTLHVDEATKARVQRLKETGEGLFTALRKYHDRARGFNSRATPMIVDGKEESSEDQPDRNLVKAKFHYADLLENIAEPFWPQQRTEATRERKSVYGQDAHLKEKKRKEQGKKQGAGKGGQKPAITESGEETKPDEQGENRQDYDGTETESQTFTPAAAKESMKKHEEDNNNGVHEEQPPDEHTGQPSYAALTDKTESSTAHPPAIRRSRTHADESKPPASESSCGLSKSPAPQEHRTPPRRQASKPAPEESEPSAAEGISGKPKPASAKPTVVPSREHAVEVSATAPRPQPAKSGVGQSKSPPQRTPVKQQPHSSATDGLKKIKPEKSQKPKIGRESETTLEARGMLSAILLAAETANDEPQAARSQVTPNGVAAHMAPNSDLKPSDQPQGVRMGVVPSTAVQSDKADAAVTELDNRDMEVYPVGTARDKSHDHEPFPSRSVVREDTAAHPTRVLGPIFEPSEVAPYDARDRSEEAFHARSTLRHDSDALPAANVLDKSHHEKIFPARLAVRLDAEVHHTTVPGLESEPPEMARSNVVMDQNEAPFPAKSAVRPDAANPTATALDESHHEALFSSRSLVGQNKEDHPVSVSVPEPAPPETAESHTVMHHMEGPFPTRSIVGQDTEIHPTAVSSASTARSAESRHERRGGAEGTSKTLELLGVPAQATSTHPPAVAPSQHGHPTPSRHFAAEASSFIDLLISSAPSETPSQLEPVPHMPPPSPQRMSHMDTDPSFLPSSSPSVRPPSLPSENGGTVIQQNGRVEAVPTLTSYEQNEPHGNIETSHLDTGNSSHREGHLHERATVPKTQGWLPGPHPQESAAVGPAQSTVYDEEPGPLPPLHQYSATHSPPLASNVSFNRSAVSPSQAGIGHAPSNMMDILLNGFDKPGFTAYDRDRSTPESGISEGNSPGNTYLSGGNISTHQQQLPNPNPVSPAAAAVNEPQIYRNDRSLAPDGYA